MNPRQSGPATFLTGATGFIGAEILRRLLAREPERTVYVLVRASDARAAARRGREVLFRLYLQDEEATERARQRIRWIPGDLSAPRLGLEPADRGAIAAACDEVIHAAASTDWDLALDEADTVNFAGVVAMAELTAELARGGRPARLVHISTAYVAGRREGHILPADLPADGDPFNNTYERTKAKAERFLRERMGELPITVVRPSIVVGDSRTGRTFNFNVLYFPIKLLYRGLLPIVPGMPGTRLDVVPVDYVCDATLLLGRDPAAVGGTYHLTADEDAMPLTTFGLAMCDFFNGRDRGGRPPVKPPRVIGPAAWRVVRWWLGLALRGRQKRQFEAFNIYLPYILSAKRFDAGSARHLLGARLPYPPIASYILQVAEYALTREWGQDVSWDPALMPQEA